jgi:hypothetical protein
MAAEQYAASRFKVWAVFETESGLVRFDDIISFSSTFALNSIPTASLIVAVGVNALTNEPATIHKAKAQLQPRDKVTVTLQVLPGGGDIEKLRPGVYTVFEGFFVGIGYQRSHNHANYALNLVHWLDNLNNVSAINGNWFPGVPHDAAQQATYDRIIDEVPSFSPVPSFGADFASQSNMSTDLWGSVIKPLFLKLAGYSGNDKQDRDSTDPTRNETAKEALDRIPGAAPKYVPLKFQIGPDDALNIPESIAKYFSNSVGSSFVQNSFWAKLITDYAAQFLFAISPAVKWAVPIPFCSGLRWKAGGKLIKASEYNYANFNTNMSQVVEGVSIAYPIASGAGLPDVDRGGTDLRLSYYQPCAIYPDPEDKQSGQTKLAVKRGFMLFKTAPVWASAADPGSTAALSSSTDARSTTSNEEPQHNNLPPNVNSTENAFLEIRNIMQKYAQQLYITEVLQSRYGELSGPLRFDIAPGSIVKIATPPRDRTQSGIELAEDDPVEYVVASVMSVSCVINSERAIAGTSFAIAHTKTENELKSPLYAVDNPPLYEEAWQDGPLAVREA